MNDIKLSLNKFSKVVFGLLVFVMLVMVLMIIFFGQILAKKISYGFDSEVWFSLFPLLAPLGVGFLIGRKLVAGWKSRNDCLIFSDSGIDIQGGNKKFSIN